jgi:hypothetical protein
MASLEGNTTLGSVDSLLKDPFFFVTAEVLWRIRQISFAEFCRVSTELNNTIFAHSRCFVSLEYASFPAQLLFQSRGLNTLSARIQASTIIHDNLSREPAR